MIYFILKMETCHVSESSIKNCSTFDWLKTCKHFIAFTRKVRLCSYIIIWIWTTCYLLRFVLYSLIVWCNRWCCGYCYNKILLRSQASRTWKQQPSCTIASEQLVHRTERPASAHEGSKSVVIITIWGGRTVHKLINIEWKGISFCLSKINPRAISLCSPKL